jgi:hypothetical protein
MLVFLWNSEFFGFSAEGTVIANDVDLSRCYTLAHQTNRLGSPSLLITNYDAEKFPLIPIPPSLRTGNYSSHSD